MIAHSDYVHETKSVYYYAIELKIINQLTCLSGTNQFLCAGK